MVQKRNLSGVATSHDRLVVRSVKLHSIYEAENMPPFVAHVNWSRHVWVKERLASTRKHIQIYVFMHIQYKISSPGGAIPHATKSTSLAQILIKSTDEPVKPSTSKIYLKITLVFMGNKISTVDSASTKCPELQSLYWRTVKLRKESM